MSTSRFLKLLKVYGITQMEIARLLKLKNRATVSQWLIRGKIPTKHLENLENIFERHQRILQRKQGRQIGSPWL